MNNYMAEQTFLEDQINQVLEDPNDLANELSVDTIESPFRTNILSARMARDKTRENLKELSRILGQNLNVEL